MDPMNSEGITEISTIPAPRDDDTRYNATTILAVPEWEAVITGTILSLIVLLTLVGNSLVILSVFTYRPLRIAPNFFIVSLAMTDITVALLVFPFSVAYCLTGRWLFGVGMCKAWMTLNVLCCSASILHLCAIALDRYWAIKDPVAYARKRTLRRVLGTICVIWLFSFSMSSILLVGKNESFDRLKKLTTCSLRSYANYVVSVIIVIFYLVLFVVTIIYMRIFVTVRSRLRVRARNSVLEGVNRCLPATIMTSTLSHSNTLELVDMDGGGGQSHSKREAEGNEREPSGSRPGRDVPKSNPLSTSESGSGSMIGERDGKEEEGPTSKGSGRCSEDFSSGDESTSGENRVHEGETQVDGPTGALGAAGGVTVRGVSPYDKASAGKLNEVHQFIEERQKISLSKERRLARTLGLIMGVFVVCWLPFFIMYLIVPFCSSCRPSQKIANFITWLGYLNSTLNPIIFTIFNLEFRKAFKTLLRIKS